MDMKSYPQSRLSMLVFGSYMIIVGGIGFGFFPHTISSLVHLKTTDNTYIRMFGLLAGILGINYLAMVRQSAISFFKFSVAMRYLAALFMIYLVATGLSQYSLLLFAAGDIMATTWTLIALRNDNQSLENRSNQADKKY